MIHCHDDNKQLVIIDQYLFLEHIYKGTIDWRRNTTIDRRRNLTWKKELFYVEQPFRIGQKKKKKRSYDEAFNEPENDLIVKVRRKFL